MASSSNLNPKMYQELIDRIKNGQPIDDLMSNYDPEATGNILDNAAAEYTKGNHPFDFYEKPELFSKVKTKINPTMPDYGSTNYVQDAKTGIQYPDDGITINLKDPTDKGTLFHESQHAYDVLSRPETLQPIEGNPKSILTNVQNDLDITRKLNSPTDLKGIDEATAYFSNHFKPDVEDRFGKLKQMLNLERIVKGEPLKMIAPVMGALGTAAIGASALGIGNKAMAGDFKGATGDALDLGTDLTPIVGEAKMALNPTDTGNSELPSDIEDQKNKFNKTRQMLLNQQE